MATGGRKPFEFSDGRVQDITHADAAKMLKVVAWAAATSDSACGACSRADGIATAVDAKEGCVCCLARKVADALEQRRRMRVWRSRSTQGRTARARRAA